jgi:hypothetical protein
MKSKSIKIGLGLVFLSLAFGCGMQFQTASLPIDTPLAHAKPSKSIDTAVNVLSKNNGVISDFQLGFANWVVSHKDKVATYPKNGAMVIESSGAGPAYEEIALTFAPTDFSKARELHLKAKVDGLVIPNIRMDLVDEKGRSTNSKLHSCKLSPRTDYQEYIYRYNDAFKQNWPSKDLVDSTHITKIRININGGGTPYFGKIYFDNLQAVAF